MGVELNSVGDVVLAALTIGAFVWAVIYILFIRKDRFTEYSRMCECEYGFTPNPHDGRCAVCRGWER
jgi:hypothetical protein